MNTTTLRYALNHYTGGALERCNAIAAQNGLEVNIEAKTMADGTALIIFHGATASGRTVYFDAVEVTGEGAKIAPYVRLAEAIRTRGRDLDGKARRNPKLN